MEGRRRALQPNFQKEKRKRTVCLYGFWGLGQLRKPDIVAPG